MAEISVAFIKELANAKNMSLTDLEKRANIGNGTIGKWNSSMPNISSLQKIADVLECNVKDLIIEKEQKD